MIKQLSFTRYEHKILPNFRQMISKAESAMHRYKHLQKHPEKTKAKIKFP
jgi:hypothetical protein